MGTTPSLTKEEKRFARWARKFVIKRARKMKIPFREEDIAHFTHAGYHIVYLAYVDDPWYDEDGELVSDLTPIAWASVPDPEITFSEGNVASNEEGEISVQYSMPSFHSVFPELAVVLTPEGEKHYRKQVREVRK